MNRPGRQRGDADRLRRDYEISERVAALRNSLASNTRFLKPPAVPCSRDTGASRAQLSIAPQRWDACRPRTPRMRPCRSEPVPLRWLATGDCPSGSNRLGEPFGPPQSPDPYNLLALPLVRLQPTRFCVGRPTTRRAWPPTIACIGP